MGKKSLLIVYASDVIGLGNRDRLTTICKVWRNKDYSVSVLITESMNAEFSEFNRREDLHLKILHIPYTKAIKKLSYIRVFISYIPRMLFGSLAKIPDDIGIIYSMTGIITEILPAFIFKLENPHLKWIVLIDNLVASPLSNKRKQHFFIKIITYITFLITIQMCKKADIVLTVNKHVKEGLVRMGISNDKIIYTSNGIKLEDIFLIEDSKEKKFDGVFIGRLDHSKGIFSLIDMWRELCDYAKRDLKLAVIGKGTHDIEATIKEKIREKTLQDSIKMFGYLSGIEKYKIMKSSRFFVFPSIDESWGIVIMEALACGLPVIAYDLEAYKEMYPSGIIEKVPVRDTEQFVNSMKNMYLDSKNNPQKSKERIDFAAAFDWKDIIEKEYYNIIHRI